MRWFESGSSTIYERRLRGRSHHLAGSFPNIAHRVARRISTRCSCRDEHGLDDASLSSTGCGSTRAKITKRTQGRPSRYARGGQMTHPFIARDVLPLNPCQNYETNPRPPSRYARGGQMTHPFIARDGLPLNPCQNYETNPRPPFPVRPRRPDGAPVYCS